MCGGSCQNINKYKNYKYQIGSGDLHNGFQQRYLHCSATEIILEFFPPLRDSSYLNYLLVYILCNELTCSSDSGCRS